MQSVNEFLSRQQQQQQQRDVYVEWRIGKIYIWRKRPIHEQCKQNKPSELKFPLRQLQFASVVRQFSSRAVHTHRRSDRYKFDFFFLSDFLQVISFCSCSTRQTMNLARCRNSWEHKFINPEFYLEFCVFLLSTAAMPHLVNCIGLTTTTIHTHTHREGASERESEERKWVSSISARLNCQSLQVTPSREQSGHNFPGKPLPS